MDNINNYLKEFKELREDIENGMSTWKDALELRERYNIKQVSLDTLRRGSLIFDEFNKNGWISQPEYLEENNFRDKEINEYLANGNISSDKYIEIFPEDINNSEILLKAHGFNANNFELVSAKNSKWQGGKNGKLKYSSKIVVKPKEKILNEEFYKELLDYFKELSKRDVKKDYSNYQYGKESILFCAFDVHYGRYASEEQTGEAYDLKIAHDRLIAITDNFLKKFKDRKFEEVIIPIGNDYLNSSLTGFTSSGRNKQENCNNFRSYFKSATSTLIEVIDKIANFAPTKVILCEGNHAREEEWLMGCIIEAYFRQDKRISCLDMASSTRKYHVFGKNCLGFSHGSEEKDRLYTLMQIEVPGFWALTDNHYWFTGHLHHFSMKENQGVEIWTVPAITSNDSWTNNMGYKSKKRSVIFIFDKEDGMVETHYIYVK